MPPAEAAPESETAGTLLTERTLDSARIGDHLDRLYRAAWALTGSREDAEDLVQETYARVLARPRMLRNEDDLGYLLRSLRNTFLNQKRTERRRLRTDPLPDELDLVADPWAREPSAALEATRALRGDRSAARELPRRSRRRGHHRPFLQGSGPRPTDPRGDGHEPPLPRPPTGRSPTRRRDSRRRLAALGDRPDQHSLARGGLITVRPLTRDGQRRKLSR